MCVINSVGNHDYCVIINETQTHVGTEQGRTSSDEGRDGSGVVTTAQGESTLPGLDLASHCIESLSSSMTGRALVNAAAERHQASC